jgi:hydrogenase nickel incorporation protein HypA/HybF
VLTTDDRRLTTVLPMHEVGIARSVIDAAVAAVPDGGTLSGVTVSIGPMSGVVADSLRFGYEVASKGTPAEGAELEIVEVPLVIHCDACDLDDETDDVALLRCAQCGGAVTIVSGNETLVTSVRYTEP